MRIRLSGDTKLPLDVSKWCVCAIKDCWPVLGVFLPLSPSECCDRLQPRLERSNRQAPPAPATLTRCEHVGPT